MDKPVNLDISGREKTIPGKKCFLNQIIWIMAQFSTYLKTGSMPALLDKMMLD